MYETFPKGTKQPSSKCGEQEMGSWPEEWAGDASKDRYPGEGYKGTNYDGEKNKTLKLDQSCHWPGNASKTSYPDNSAGGKCKFESEKPYKAVK